MYNSTVAPAACAAAAVPFVPLVALVIAAPEIV